MGVLAHLALQPAQPNFPPHLVSLFTGTPWQASGGAMAAPGHVPTIRLPPDPYKTPASLPSNPKLVSLILPSLTLGFGGARRLRRHGHAQSRAHRAP